MELNATLSLLASYLYSRIAAARDGGKVIDGLVYYPAKYEYAFRHVPALPTKVDTLRRLYKELEQKGLIKLLKIGNIIHFTPSPMLRSWGEEFDENENTLFFRNAEKITETVNAKTGKSNDCCGKNNGNVTENAEKINQKPIKNPHTHINIIENNIIQENDYYEKNINTPEQSCETDLFHEAGKMVLYGVTPQQIGVTRKTYDTVAKKMQGLTFPYDDTEFRKKFFILACSPKWQKKTLAALQMNLNKLSQYELEFASELIDKSIAGGWQGVVFSNTPEEYTKWKQSHTTGQMSDKEYNDMMRYLHNDF